MKKIYAAISLIMILLLFGCSQASEVTYTTAMESSVPSKIFYNIESYGFSNISDNSLLKYTFDDAEDYNIVLQQLVSSQEYYFEPSVYEIVDTLFELSDKSGTSINYLVSLTNSELNKLAVENSIILTVDDIIGFNDYKDLINILPSFVSIDVDKYISYKLGREITNTELESINLLQLKYAILMYETEFNIIENSFQDFINMLDSYNILYEQTDIVSMEEAFNIILEIIQN